MALPQAPTDSYRYEALARREIRVVVLYPLTSTGEIRCDIKRVSIDEHPAYEALSYTWGNASGNVPIRVGSGILLATKNLGAALHALSPPVSQRMIWIDAICINQNDATERNHQVLFMKDIYTRASRVLVWLGLAADNSDAVMDYIGTLNAEPDLLEHKNWVYSDTWDWSTCRPWRPLPVTQPSVDALLCRPWFSRVWIQQEAAVNRETIVICGGKKVKWNQLFSLVWSYQKPSREGFAKDTMSNDAQAPAMLLLNIQSYTYDDIPALLVDILRDCTYCGAADPRDRIYAVQSLARDPDLDKLFLEPDYNDNVSTVYTKMAERFLEVQGPFILSWAGRNNQRLRELPSWAPDWTVKNIELPSIIFKAAGNLPWNCKVRNENGLSILFARGVTLSSISALTDVPAMPAYHGRLGEREVFQSLRSHIEACIELNELQKGGDQTNENRRDLWRTLVADSTRSWTRLPKEYGDDLVTFPEWLASYQAPAPSTIPSSYLEHLETMNMRGAFIYRRFAIDSTGKMCLVPYSTRQGDSIVIIAGLTIPLVIRSLEKGRFEIIGECYVHECMDGKAMEEVRQKQYEELLFC
ncbi:hypothetical protein GJ744_004478 [Endocarpon pusillum]|uniref:Heterokaryon incompatibility domain-containing protein n=1 Tax=Endocarpon pusillum TaxID=364733 RepID=A0A8H7EAD5_9EURO|nr:hypothetical protein GJ744_004478 [Endocarpon pusillum]